MSMLRQYGMPRSQEKTETSHAYDFLKTHQNEPGRLRFKDDHFAAIQEVRSHRGAINELFDLKFSARSVSFVEHIIIPYYAPLAIAATALIALLVKFCR